MQTSPATLKDHKSTSGSVTQLFSNTVSILCGTTTHEQRQIDSYRVGSTSELRKTAENFTSELVIENKIKLTKIASALQCADILTKELG